MSSNVKYLFLNTLILVYDMKIYAVYGEIMPNIKQLTLSQEIELALQDEKKYNEFAEHTRIVNEFYGKRKNWITSNVGMLIFKDPRAYSQQFTEKHQKKFIVYIYNQWSILYTRSDLNNKSLANMLSNCSVKNCIFTRDKKFTYSADAVLVNVHKGQYPRFSRKNSNQKWVLFSLESPLYIFSGYEFKRKPSLQSFSGIFDWIMTYRSDSDVPVPFGRTVPLVTAIKVDFSNAESALEKLVPFWYLKQPKILVVTMVSNCVFKDRIRFMHSLMKFIVVDAYGDCAVERLLRKSCPGHIEEDCSVLEHYFFYLALENSQCRQYLTEKIFHNSYSKGAIPVIWGAPLEDCQKLLPPESFLHVDHYSSYEHLAQHIKRISQDKRELLKYHAWRKHFKVVNEHGFFKTQPMQLCRLCEALNYNNDSSRVYHYDDLRLFFDKNIMCSNF